MTCLHTKIVERADEAGRPIPPPYCLECKKTIPELLDEAYESGISACSISLEEARKDEREKIRGIIKDFFTVRNGHAGAHTLRDYMYRKLVNE
jgi:hypothetical protein